MGKLSYQIGAIPTQGFSAYVYGGWDLNEQRKEALRQRCLLKLYLGNSVTQHEFTDTHTIIQILRNIEVKIYSDFWG